MDENSKNPTQKTEDQKSQGDNDGFKTPKTNIEASKEYLLSKYIYNNRLP
jgi:hypothetical protein